MSALGTRFALIVCSFIILTFSTTGARQPDAGFQAAAPGGAGAAITGTVVDADLKPIMGAAVTLERAGRVIAKTTTSPQGEYRFTNVAPGDYLVRAVHGALPPFSRALRVAAGATVVRLPIVLATPIRENTVDVQAASRAEQMARSSMPPKGVAPIPPPAPTTAQGAAGGRGGRGGGVADASRSMVTRPEPYDRGWPTYRPRSGETYARIDPNRFQRTRENPLSTFGADVDTAAYTNVRRFLSSGQLPPRDAVRVEELLNYFRFDYAAPRDGRPIALTTEVGDCPWAPSHKLVLVGARAAASTAREVAGRNIVLLIDVSGSMAPAERLPLIKTALGLFVDTLRADDTISIVTYAGSSGVALYPSSLRERDRIQRTIAGLQAGGSTNGAEGLITAYRVARQAFIPGGVNRVIVATDGDFNVGITSQRDLLDLIERERESGVFLSVFGVGRDNLKDRTMEMLADRGNGHYAYLDSLQEARRLLVREADSTLETVATDVKFQVEFNPAVVSEWRLIGYENRALSAEAFNDDRKDAGELGAGHTVTVLYEIVPVGAARSEAGPADRSAVDPLRYQPQAPQPRTEPVAPRSTPQSGEWLNVKVRYKLPERETSELISQPVRAGGRARVLPMAAAVAEFGLILRDEPRNTSRWNALLRRLDNVDGPSAWTERSSFREMVEIAAGIGRLR
jgi:Ca-activated chloride channel family protein